MNLKYWESEYANYSAEAKAKGERKEYHTTLTAYNKQIGQKK